LEIFHLKGIFPYFYNMENFVFRKIVKPSNEHSPRVSMQTGFPSPATHYLEHGIDLNRELVKNPDATFYVRVMGGQYQPLGIEDKDVLIVDRSLKLKKNGLIMVCHEGEFKLIRTATGKINGPYELWGSITYIIRDL
tara:strand:- start:6823 stop:7233 length:411 start_codon:yes stop_codon:yes gene_type:complete